MHEVHQMPQPARGNHPAPLIAGQKHQAVLNLRGNAQDPAFVQAVQQALGLPLPVAACSSIANAQVRVVWVGPDDWFVVVASGQQAALAQSLRTALAGQHSAVTDVSSGYFLVTLAGEQARDVLAQRDNAPTFEMLVRRSFIDHFWQLIQHCTVDCGWIDKQAA